jgi:hypothetical protein
VAQAVKCLPTKCEALISNTSNPPQKEKKYVSELSPHFDYESGEDYKKMLCVHEEKYKSKNRGCSRHLKCH